ncbi:MAG: SUMF1/EgtB/PvdO family nonheme iron enzyme [Verrucomicrobiales bacterium]|nr:SUMF1/EgtB/PvdO family nonheme iron enzyme [Verrucomicrobiota bacterium JB025]
MSVRNRETPSIPDHEVLRKIGGGSYGEVWLARGVTGAWRAVKVVWREDFEDERGFEREFEGILKFEPISRDHPGLMNILHVGRSKDGKSFYYYVMELGDDMDGGDEINPIEYEPRTLRTNHQKALGGQWETGECIDVGLRLAEALDHLHQQGLAHRDVKPSNVIFVNGKAKLADIGLVAARGQRTFVGTEGFVPPEGPGSAQADVYSLGKVLYEIATGKDRLNFPELPEEIPLGRDRKRWLELNKIICDVCEPRISKRKVQTAGQLADALRRIQRGKRRRRSGAALWGTTAVLFGFAGWAGWQALKDSPAVLGLIGNVPEVAPEPEVGMLRVFSSVPGADVLDASGVMVGTTPTPTMTARVGEEVVFTLKMKGYRPNVIRDVVKRSAVDEPMALYADLQIFSPPEAGVTWVDHLGSVYQPVDNHHVSSGFVSRRAWDQSGVGKGLPKAQLETLRVSQNGQPVDVVLTNRNAAWKFCNWLRNSGIREGYLTEDHEVKPLLEKGFKHQRLSQSARQAELVPFRVLVRPIPYGRVHLTSVPAGAEVYLNGAAVGSTEEALWIPKVRPGSAELLLVLEGYRPQVVKVKVGENKVVEKEVVMVRNQGVVFGRPWENGVEMKFLPLGEDLMVSVWETRVMDYQLFVRETGHAAPPDPEFEQDGDHPVVNVSRKDAEEFCKWLTDRERKAERISQLHVYRLPTDVEWSGMAGLDEEVGLSPSMRDLHKEDEFPWGVLWPADGESVGNFADRSAADAMEVSSGKTIPGYDDGYAYTAPVGSFPANALGLYDLSGNAQEWVSDNYSRFGADSLGVLRGGGWNTYQIENLYAGSRNAVPPDYQGRYYGFRVVLAKLPHD